MGDLNRDRAVFWSKCDRPATLVVEWSTRENGPRERVEAQATAARDHVAKAMLKDLPPGQTVTYRAWFDDGLASEPVVGTFNVPAPDASTRIVWGGDVCGQGYGIGPDGYAIFDTMARTEPDLFIHSGDAIYADIPLEPEVALADGSLWRNLETAGKEKVAETLDEFRAQFAYNLRDRHYRAFLARTPMVAQWDDHETHNNWWPGQTLKDDRYRERSVDVLSARARRAFHEYMPTRERREGVGLQRVIHYGPVDIYVVDLRSFRSMNDANLQPNGAAAFGGRQLAWLEERIARSKARWKVIACDMPLSLLIPDGKSAWEGIANGHGGAPLGRELELASLLSGLKAREVKNVVWVTADVHYCAAHHYDPERAIFRDFDPFWELVAGPLHAGTFGPNPLDPTFGPEAVFEKGAGDAPNAPPSAGLQFFGQLDVRSSGELEVALRDRGGARLWSRVLEPL